MSSVQGSGERPMRVPCGIAGVDCPPKLGSPPCGISDEQVDGISHLAISRYVIRCQREQGRRLAKGHVTDTKTGLDSLQLMLVKAHEWYNERMRIGRGDVSILAGLIDGDRWKKMNTTHGHGVTDEAAKKMGSFIGQLIRPTDFRGRWGEQADEYLVLVPDLTRKLADRVTDRIQDKLGEGIPLEVEEGEILVRASMGTAFVAHAPTFRHVEWVIHAADRTLGAWKDLETREGQPERIYLDGSKEVPSHVPEFLVA